MNFCALFKDDPEEWNGLLVYPVKMQDYPVFLSACECITAAQQTFPYPFSTMRYLEALFAMEGALPRLALLLKLALRLPDGDTLPIYPGTSGDKIMSLLIVQGERKGEITAKNFGGLRELIAWQNGLELPDETDNAELLQARRDLSGAAGMALKASLEDLVYSVALKARADPEEIMSWTVRRFQAVERAIDRAEGHRMASVTLAAGGRFKGGNPYPSWKYDREESIQAVEPLSALSGRLSGSVEQK